jgi:hydrogenase maturation protease
MKPRVLVAGIGNIFLGDDGFGVEVIRQMSARERPDGVRVVDFGIRSYDLAFALTEGYDAVILADAVPRGEPPGTIYLMEIGAGELPKLEPETLDPHSLNPMSVLQMARAMGCVSGKLFVVGCEPAVLETEDGLIQLSAAVKAAVPQAIMMIEELISDLSRSEETTNAGLVPV